MWTLSNPFVVRFDLLVFVREVPGADVSETEAEIQKLLKPSYNHDKNIILKTDPTSIYVLSIGGCVCVVDYLCESVQYITSSLFWSSLSQCYFGSCFDYCYCYQVSCHRKYTHCNIRSVLSRASFPTHIVHLKKCWVIFNSVLGQKCKTQPGF